MKPRECVECGASIPPYTAGRPRVTCTNKCSDKRARRQSRQALREMDALRRAHGLVRRSEVGPDGVRRYFWTEGRPLAVAARFGGCA